ncbi:MAG: glycosyltransferase family 4 protein [Bacteroidales bacterium]|nr:glycosyltransferase family 4 protein [Bacteroidales bacterium]
MKVAFITFGDIHDIRNWSGAVKAMHNVVQSSADEILVIDRIEKRCNLPVVFLFKILEKIFRRSFQIKRMPVNLKRIAKYIENLVSDAGIDLMFSPSSLPFAYINSDIPKVFWTDATFKQLTDYYPEYKGLSDRVIYWGNKHEKLSLDNVNMAVYTSEWAARSAVDDYMTSTGKVRIIPLGSNMHTTFEQTEIMYIIHDRICDSSVRLLSVGLDWKRKGFDLTLLIAQKIAEKGYKVVLSVAGARPLVNIKPAFVYQNYGRLIKTNPAHFRIMTQLYKESHFFVLPSTAECAGIVFAEASAFALPSMTRNTGGIPTMVENGKNGFVLDYNAPAEDYADKIIETFNNKEVYKKLCLSSFEKYNRDLSWSRASELFNRYVEEITGDRHDGKIAARK